MSQHGALQVIVGDITRVNADAIVNAANTLLRPGGGVCGAIFRAAGVEKLTAACDAIGGCLTGSAVLTPAFGIPTAQHIIHAGQSTLITILTKLGDCCGRPTPLHFGCRSSHLGD
jgi:O-acetyl-ADP-ribose deacetylase (regulator of RNase III)